MPIMFVHNVTFDHNVTQSPPNLLPDLQIRLHGSHHIIIEIDHQTLRCLPLTLNPASSPAALTTRSSTRSAIDNEGLAHSTRPCCAYLGRKDVEGKWRTAMPFGACADMERQRRKLTVHAARSLQYISVRALAWIHRLLRGRC